MRQAEEQSFAEAFVIIEQTICSNGGRIIRSGNNMAGALLSMLAIQII